MGQNDSGLFETNLRDERYLPFENSGVVSEWQLELPANPSKKDPRQFDYDTTTTPDPSTLNSCNQVSQSH